ncbi:mercury(II) reductase [Elioraea sp.]|uniref:mercury(II) reductase n=1 Tax=Elioraea sp. TaxID=2185103 RepID=UPI0021DD5FAC|nr:mercury(II) reductase [Elioraea sp.]GIX11802.1 MAG: mercuric reductase MerA [Elioraea sp.]
MTKRNTIGEAGNGGYDIAVIGAGSAGFSAAITAAEQGARVALIGHGTIGGTCVNTGCVPSKTLIRAAEALHQAEAASRFKGIRAGAWLEDWRAVLRQKNELVASLRQAKYVDLLPSYNTIAYLEGWARFENGGVTVDGVPVRSDKVIVTTGASPSLPPIPGIDSVPYLTSMTALELETLPRSLIVLGGGYIGCELGQMFARMGVEVTIVDIVPILPAAEPEISRALAGYFRDEGITLHENVKTRAIRRTEHGVALDVSSDGKDETIEAEQVLVTTGRRPNTAGLGLEDAGVGLLPNGGIQVDERMRTTRAGVYAAGDVTGRDMFVYMAAYGAKIAAKNALNGDGLTYDNNAMPWVVFTAPQVAGVGLTEAQAREAGHEIKTSLLPLDQVPRALAARDTRGLIKLVADARTGRLLGAHILAPEGADSIQTAALAIRQGLTGGDLAETIFPYLTTVEGLKLAAQAFEKDVAKLSCCAG